MKTNDLKKGAVVRLRNGWYAVIADNMKGNTRMATVHGHYTETGSVYAHDIVAYYPDTTIEVVKTRITPPPVRIEHTPAQIKLMRMSEGGGW